MKKQLPIWMGAATLLCLYLKVGAVVVAFADEDVPYLAERGYLIDPQGLLTSAQVAATDPAKFVPFEEGLSLGFTSDVVWMRFEVVAGQGKPMVALLEFTPAFIDDIRIHYRSADGAVVELRSGDRMPFAERPEPYRNPLFRLHLPAGQTTLFARLSGAGLVAASPRIWKPTDFQENARKESLLYGMYFGVLIAVAMMSVVGWLASGQGIFAIYLLYLSLVGLQWSINLGFVGQYVLPSHPLLNNQMVAALVALAAAAAWWFFMVILDLKRHHPLILRIAQLGILVSLVTALSVPLGGYQFFSPLLLLLALVSLSTAPWPCIRLWKSGGTWERVLAASYIIYCALVAQNILVSLAYLPWNDLWVQTGLGSILAHVYLLQIAIYLRYRRSESEKAEVAISLEKARLETNAEKAIQEQQDRFLRLLAHETRTPVAAIDSARQVLELLDEDMPSKEQSDRNRRYATIRHAVQRLKLLVNVAIDRERSDGPSWELNKEAVAIRTVPDLLMQVLDPAIGERVVSSVAVEEGAVWADRTMLQFALLNVVENSAKYSPASAPIYLDISHLIHEARPGFLIAIKDLGRGVKAGEEARIFERHTRGADAAIETGLGLGLYIARQVIEQNEGWIKAVPTEVSGGLFHVWLPTTHKTR